VGGGGVGGAPAALVAWCHVWSPTGVGRQKAGGWNARHPQAKAVCSVWYARTGGAVGSGEKGAAMQEWRHLPPGGHVAAPVSGVYGSVQRALQVARKGVVAVCVWQVCVAVVCGRQVWQEVCGVCGV